MIATSSLGYTTVLPLKISIVQTCSTNNMTVTVGKPIGEEIIKVDNKKLEDSIIAWQNFVAHSNSGCNVSIGYQVTIESVLGSVNSDWFTVDTQSHQITFSPRKIESDSRLQITIVGMIGGLSTNPSATDVFNLFILQSTEQLPIEIETPLLIQQFVTSYLAPAKHG